MTEFTTEEQQLILQYTRSRGFRDWIWFYSAVLVAPLAMAAYGLAQRDVLAMAIAFVGVLACWPGGYRVLRETGI